MYTLNWLRQLHRITHQHDVARGRAGGHDVGQRHLARLVDEQIIELLVVLGSRKQPSSAAHQRVVAEALILVVITLPRSPDRSGPSPFEIFLMAFSSTPASRARFATAISRLSIALCEFEVTATRLPHADQRQNRVRADIGLARPRRSLDRQRAVVELSHSIDCRLHDIGVFRNQW